LRRSELFALKWHDVDFSNLTIAIKRSIFQGVIGDCKTEASRRPIPLSLEVAADLWLWKETTRYAKPEDWIFASPHVDGHKPFWPDIVISKVVQPAAKRADITKRIGWHTFRHTYSTMLVANGENGKVVQELMRHANSRSTLNICSQARIQAKRDAQRRVVQVILSEKSCNIKLSIRNPNE
jgi:integrase